MAKQNDQPQTTLTPAEADVTPPAQWYTRDSKPNPRVDDVKAASEATATRLTQNEADPENAREAPWFRIAEGNKAAAKKTDTLLRRAAKQLSVQIRVKLPQTEPGMVYFRVPFPESEAAPESGE